jgi:hypothetical protein
LREKLKFDLRAGVFVRELDGETLASLLAAAAEYFASPPRGHALAKAMCPDAALVTGTVGGLAHTKLRRPVENVYGCRTVKLSLARR